jgi:hypothetical protein
LKLPFVARTAASALRTSEVQDIVADFSSAAELILG